MLKVGLIGFGLAGQAFHAPVIRATPGLELACILERHGSLAREKFQGIRVVRTLDDLLDDREIQLCVVATPNTTHFELARRCMEAGRNVVVEKPLAVSSQEAAELIRVAESTGRVLSVYQNRRWDGDFLTVKRLLASGRLGRIVQYESNWDRFRPTARVHIWRESGEAGSGVLYDLGSHLIDQAMALFGQPEAITADERIMRDGARAADAFDVRMHYAGLDVTLRTCLLACAPRPRFCIFGTQGSFVKLKFDPQEGRLRRGESPDQPGWGDEPESEWGTAYFAEGGSVKTEKVKTEKGDYREFYGNVRDAVLTDSPLAVTPQDALRTLRAIELAHASSERRSTIEWDAAC